jgi:hypothetical protein
MPKSKEENEKREALIALVVVLKFSMTKPRVLSNYTSRLSPTCERKERKEKVLNSTLGKLVTCLSEGVEAMSQSPS